MDSVDGRGLSKVPQITLGFWIIKIAAITLGATVGDFRTSPSATGGLDWSRPLASAVLAIFIIRWLFPIPQRPGRHSGALEDEPAQG